jgi:hypothetical protein
MLVAARAGAAVRLDPDQLAQVGGHLSRPDYATGDPEVPTTRD